MKSEWQLSRLQTFKITRFTSANGTKRTLRYTTPESENGQQRTLNNCMKQINAFSFAYTVPSIQYKSLSSNTLLVEAAH
jgi:hypothetical protein